MLTKEDKWDLIESLSQMLTFKSKEFTISFNNEDRISIKTDANINIAEFEFLNILTNYHDVKRIKDEAIIGISKENYKTVDEFISFKDIPLSINNLSKLNIIKGNNSFNIVNGYNIENNTIHIHFNRKMFSFFRTNKILEKSLKNYYHSLDLKIKMHEMFSNIKLK